MEQAPFCTTDLSDEFAYITVNGSPLPPPVTVAIVERRVGDMFVWELRQLIREEVHQALTDLSRDEMTDLARKVAGEMVTLVRMTGGSNHG